MYTRVHVDVIVFVCMHIFSLQQSSVVIVSLQDPQSLICARKHILVCMYRTCLYMLFLICSYLFELLCLAASTITILPSGLSHTDRMGGQ